MVKLECRPDTFNSCRGYSDVFSYAILFPASFPLILRLSRRIRLCWNTLPSTIKEMGRRNPALEGRRGGCGCQRPAVRGVLYFYGRHDVWDVVLRISTWNTLLGSSSLEYDPSSGTTFFPLPLPRNCLDERSGSSLVASFFFLSLA
ncbi:hypothetical protein ARMGADRAFT_46048 [Armillaria gallica]|uniref:Uncharacterized protein n=1 Tax=Armillaria gallica TaxID=47427 RepID=A0A2H3ED92_ARMGA|nr:hypothetical protein ARMGADRAFT_46048 [Armillaria gallica]